MSKNYGRIHPAECRPLFAPVKLYLPVLSEEFYVYGETAIFPCGLSDPLPKGLARETSPPRQVDEQSGCGLFFSGSHLCRVSIKVESARCRKTFARSSHVACNSYPILCSGRIGRCACFCFSSLYWLCGLHSLEIQPLPFSRETKVNYIALTPHPSPSSSTLTPQSLLA